MAAAAASNPPRVISTEKRVISAEIQVTKIEEGKIPQISKESMLDTTFLVGTFLYGPIQQSQTTKQIQQLMERTRLKPPTATLSYELWTVKDQPEAIDVKMHFVATKWKTSHIYFPLARLNPSSHSVPAHLHGRMYNVEFNKDFEIPKDDTTYTVCFYDIEQKPTSTDNANKTSNDDLSNNEIEEEALPCPVEENQENSSDNEIEKKEPPLMPSTKNGPPETTIDSTPPNPTDIDPVKDKKEVDEKKGDKTTKLPETNDKQAPSNNEELPAPAKSFPWNFIDKVLSILAAPFKLIASAFKWLTAKTEA